MLLFILDTLKKIILNIVNTFYNNIYLHRNLIIKLLNV
jgi:hypothetical protein